MFTSRKLKSAFAIALLAVLGHAHAQKPATVTSNADTPSHHTAKDMADLYHDVSQDCGVENSDHSKKRPAFLCSGVIIRTAVPGNDWNVWDLSDDDKKSNGVSFSYLREDIDLGELGGPNASGFTVFPLYGEFNAPVEKHALQVMCSFPLDGWSNFRKLNGCGESSLGKGSGECQDQGIFTASQWVQHYRNAPAGANPALWQCAFDVHNKSKYDTDHAFIQSITARKALQETWVFNDRNELRIELWEGVKPKDLPIQSFFYVDAAGGTGAGVFYAQISQKRYHDLTGIFIPVVRIYVPRTPREQFDFFVRDQDQVIPYPQ